MTALRRRAVLAMPAALAVLTALLATPVAGEAGAPSAQAAAPRLLDVPYIAQSEDLCGGAALAMVRRYWGDPDAVAEDFAPLVDPVEGGIRTGRLADAAATGPWTAVPLSADAGPAASIADQIARGRPMIALIRDRPDVLHYVVVVAWTDQVVVFHDPARAPYQTLTPAEFDRRWAASGRWMLLLLPGATGASSDPRTAGPQPAASTTRSPSLEELATLPECAALARVAIDSAAASRLGEAAAALDRAVALCPADAVVWRERAGVRFLARDWAAAAADAERAADLDAADDPAWRILGTARFMLDDPRGALDAFNRVGTPLVNRIDVTGARRTPQPVVIGATGLAPRRLLTASTFGRAARRLADLPIARRTALRFAPTSDDAVVVEAVVAERRSLPVGLAGWGIEAARTLATQTIRIAAAGPTGSGELWSGSWRWEGHRPRVTFAVATPTPGRLPGVATVEALWERQSYGGGGAENTDGAGSAEGDADPVTEGRRRVGLTLADWASPDLRWQTGAFVDRMRGRSHAAATTRLDRRLSGDRVSIAITLDGWAGAASRFGRVTAVAALRSSVDVAPAIAFRAGVSRASAAAPRAIWPRAGTGADTLAPLRAHPFHDDGIIREDRLGRQVIFATAEHVRPVVAHSAFDLRAAVFADAAVTSLRAASPGRRADLDVGVGLRIGAAGLDGLLALDLAWGVAGGGFRFAVGSGLD